MVYIRNYATKKVIICCFVLLFCANALFAQDLPISESNVFEEFNLYPSEEVLELCQLDADNYVDKAINLLKAAIYFSGSSQERQEAAFEKGCSAIFDIDAISSATRENNSSLPFLEQELLVGQAVQDYLHSVINSYQTYEADFDKVILDGIFNCGGSATYFAILATAAGLDTRSVFLDEHVYCYLTIDGHRIDVETTSPNGFNVDRKEVIGTEIGNDVGLKTLMCVSLWNKSTLNEKNKNWAIALSEAVTSFAYSSGGLVSYDQGDPVMWDSLFGRINNCISYLNDEQRYLDATIFSEKAIELYGQNPKLEQLFLLSNSNLFYSRIEQASPEEAGILIDEENKKGFLSQSEIIEAAEYVCSVLVSQNQTQNLFYEAWQIALEYSEKYPTSKNIKSMVDNSIENWVIDNHNKFANFYNTKQFDKAKLLLEEAIKILPDNKILKNDLAAVNKVLKK